MLQKSIAIVGIASLVMVGSVGVADATIHPIVSSECAAKESATGAGESQDPPGQTPGATPGEGENELAAINALLANGALVLVDPGDDFPETAVWGGPAYNGDSGDEHCKNPDHNTHSD